MSGTGFAKNLCVPPLHGAGFAVRKLTTKGVKAASRFADFAENLCVPPLHGAGFAVRKINREGREGSRKVRKARMIPTQAISPIAFVF